MMHVPKKTPGEDPKKKKDESLEGSSSSMKQLGKLSLAEALELLTPSSDSAESELDEAETDSSEVEDDKGKKEDKAKREKGKGKEKAQEESDDKGKGEEKLPKKAPMRARRRGEGEGREGHARNRNRVDLGGSKERKERGDRREFLERIKAPVPKDGDERLEHLMGVLDYDLMNAGFKDEKIGDRGAKVGKGDLEMLQNGGLFLEAINVKAEEEYNAKGVDPDPTLDEKLHVPATAKDVPQRWALVSRLCLARGVVNWKVARQEVMDNKVSGTDHTFEALCQAGVVDAREEAPGKPAVHYVKLAMRGDRREALEKMLGGKPLEGRPESEIVQDVIAHCENAILAKGAFPEEQSGREITVYIKPKMLGGVKGTSEFVSELYAAFETSGLPMLPIAAGDRAIAGGGVKKAGKTYGYFSYRNEGSAYDKQLGYGGFPHWLGGNHDKSNAPKKKGDLSGAKVTKPKKKSRFKRKDK